MPSWQLQEAKNRLSELVDRAIADGPQTITRHGLTVVTRNLRDFRRFDAPVVNPWR